MKFTELSPERRAELGKALIKARGEYVMCWCHCHPCHRSFGRFWTSCVEKFEAEKNRTDIQCPWCGRPPVTYHNDENGPEPYPKGWHFPTKNELDDRTRAVCAEFGVEVDDRFLVKI